MQNTLRNCRTNFGFYGQEIMLKIGQKRQKTAITPTWLNTLSQN